MTACDKIGKRAEDIVARMFAAREPVRAVERITGDRQFTHGDLLVHMTNGKEYFVEVKSVEKDLIIETWSDLKRNRPGWIQNLTNCDIIAFYVRSSKKLVMLPFRDLKDFHYKHGAGYYKRTPRADQPNHTVYYFVPIEDIRGLKRLKIEAANG